MIYTLKTIFILICFFDIAYRQPVEFSLNDFDVGPPGDIARERVARKKIVISKDITLDALIEVDSHGHGHLAIANLEYVAVYDCCGCFRNTLLNIKFADFDGDGYRDLIIYGIEDFYGEKDDNLKTIRGSRLIVHLYRFNPKQRKFETIFKYAPDWKPIYY